MPISRENVKNKKDPLIEISYNILLNIQLYLFLYILMKIRETHCIVLSQIRTKS